MDKMELILEGPLTKSELTSRASKKFQLFVIKFPKLENQTAFLDTEEYGLSYRGESISPYNLSSELLLKYATIYKHL